MPCQPIRPCIMPGICLTRWGSAVVSNSNPGTSMPRNSTGLNSIRMATQFVM
ncbi:hypothetical protein GJ631_13505 [Natronomonas sp. CBA1123]|uniref:hypothetical protein n=1 Tax=Natronomonas sp. CBA1123 TaxID=2668070 RepID=UPI0012E9BC5C|nr:hypothetical protein [Natronomonas sp. CBA1123]MUV87549.1 hypothetical protein [Natronomonas sp. CBA1123]